MRSLIGTPAGRCLAALLAAFGLGLATLPASAVAAAGTSPGQLYSFGENYLGQLGYATNDKTEEPNPTPTLISLPGQSGAINAATAGAFHSFVTTSGGQLYSFGDNYFGQLGYATNDKTEEPNPTPTLVSLPGQSGSVVQIAADDHSLVLTSTAQLYSFGDNKYGQLGYATNDKTEEPNPTPTLVSLPGATGPVTRVATGTYYSLVLTSTGQLYSFGDNKYGQLGYATNDKTEEPNPTPTLVSLPGQSGPITQIAASGSHSLVLTSTGQLYSFGENYRGQLGYATNDKTEEPNPTPTLVSLPGQSGPITQIAAGGYHSLVLTSTGQLYSFGENYFGQLGYATNDKTEEPNPTPTPVVLPGLRGSIVKIDTDFLASFVLTSTGQLYSFGDNKYGQLGYATNDKTEEPNPTPTPVSLPGGGSVETIAPSSTSEHTLVVVADLAVSTSSLPAGEAGVPYSAQLQGVGGAAPYRWSASGLPPGLSIDQATGSVSGTPTAAGRFTPTFTVTDAGRIEASAPLAITIAAAATSAATTSMQGAVQAAGTACPAPSGMLGAAALGPLELGFTRARARAAMGAHTDSANGFEAFCLSPNAGISAKYATRSMLRRLPARKRRHLRRRVVLLLTANPYYALDGARQGVRFASVKGALHARLAFAANGNAWYVREGARTNGVVMVSGGVVRYVGVATRLLRRRAGHRLALFA